MGVFVFCIVCIGVVNVDCDDVMVCIVVLSGVLLLLCFGVVCMCWLVYV